LFAEVMVVVVVMAEIATRSLLHIQGYAGAFRRVVVVVGQKREGAADRNEIPIMQG
jgi:hypothetical protein